MSDSDQTPSEPFMGLAAAAVQLHEMFVSLTDAGFTEDQALKIVIAAVARGVQP